MTEKYTCSFCGRLAPEGLRVHGEVICRACETRMLRLKVDDEDYEGWVSAIRSLWRRWSEEEGESSRDGTGLTARTPD